MKKKLFFVLTAFVAVLTLSLTSCKEDEPEPTTPSSLEGTTWTSSSSMLYQELEFEDGEVILYSGFNSMFMFQDDYGPYTYTTGSGSIDFEYEEESVPFTVNVDKLTIELDGVSYVFKKSAVVN